MRHTGVVIVGGGQAGLATSVCLSSRNVDHVVLERGRVGERWRSERWPSLTLLTPNWLTRLPGYRYDGDDPDGYMGTLEVAELLERYAAIGRVPVERQTTVARVEPSNGAFIVSTNRGEWRTANVVIATGYSDVPSVPAASRQLAAGLLQLTPGEYRGAEHLPPGGVLVVGAAASGIQLADEIQASGRPVTLAVGRHLRLPRVYRGRDILAWLDAMGLLAESTGQVADIEVSRRQPSLQLVGRPNRSTLDLAVLQQRGVRLVGRLRGAESGHRLCLDDDLTATVAAADIKLASLLGRIDAFIARSHPEAPKADPFVPYWPLVPADAPTSLDLKAEGIRTVVWATGFRRDYRWLRAPAFDGRGELAHEEGVTKLPGLFAVGLQFQRRRNSAFIDGVGDDAAFIAERIASRGRE